MTRVYYNIIVARDKLHKLLSRRKATERGINGNGNDGFKNFG